MKKKLAVIVSLVLVLSTIVGFVPTTVSAAAGQIGVVLPTNSESRWPMAYNQFVALDPSLKGQILYSNNNPATENTNVKSLVDKGCKVIIICPYDGKAAAAEADYAKSKGCTVISYDRMIMNTKSVDYYVTFDSVAVGKAQAQYLVDNAKGKGNHLYLFAGAVTDDNAFTFFQGSWSVLQPKIADGTFVVENSSQATALKNTANLTRAQMSSIINAITTKWDPPTAKNLAQAALAKASAAQKGTCYILSPNDDTSRAITDAFRADPKVTAMYSTGQDFTQASLQYIIDGKQGMTVAKLDKYLVQDSLKIANTVLAGKTPGSDIIKQQYNNGAKQVPSTLDPITTVTINNVASIINESGLYKLTVSAK